jgi:hypothetical protein
MPPIEFKIRHDTPNFDLRGNEYPPQGGYAGDLNACATVATANSFAWLRKHEPAIDSLLMPDFGMGEDSLRKILFELSAMMIREDTQGVLLPEHLRGKLAFTDRYKLPVKIKFQAVASLQPKDTVFSPDPAYQHFAHNQTSPDTTVGQHTEPVSRAWLFQELCDGEDVEMQYHCCQFLNGVHQPQLCFAHAAVMTGMVRMGDRYGVAWNDDQDQLDQNIFGLRNNFFSHIWINKQDTTDYLILGALSDTIRLNEDTILTMRCFIESAISESYDSTVTFVPVSAFEPATAPPARMQVYPNPLPSGRELRCAIELSSIAPVRFGWFDLTGVARFFTGFQPVFAGMNTFDLPALDLAPGMYILVVEQSGQIRARELIAVR